MLSSVCSHSNRSRDVVRGGRSYKVFNFLTYPSYRETMIQRTKHSVVNAQISNQQQKKYIKLLLALDVCRSFILFLLNFSEIMKSIRINQKLHKCSITSSATWGEKCTLQNGVKKGYVTTQQSTLNSHKSKS